MTELHDAIHEAYRRVLARRDEPRVFVVPANWNDEQIEFCRSVINGTYVRATLNDDDSDAG